MQYSGEQESWKAGNVSYSRSTDRKWRSNLYSNDTPSRKVYRKEQPKGQPEGDAVKGKIRKRWVENKSTECASTKKIEIRPTTITVAWRRGWSNSKTTKWELLERVVPICVLGPTLYSNFHFRKMIRQIECPVNSEPALLFFPFHTGNSTKNIFNCNLGKFPDINIRTNLRFSSPWFLNGFIVKRQVY